MRTGGRDLVQQNQTNIVDFLFCGLVEREAYALTG